VTIVAIHQPCSDLIQANGWPAVFACNFTPRYYSCKLHLNQHKEIPTDTGACPLSDPQYD
jgi:hypothetical protein